MVSRNKMAGLLTVTDKMLKREIIFQVIKIVAVKG